MSSAQSHRLHTSLLVLILITGLAILATLASSAFGGPLDPPAPPGSTMKTLQQVEPRTPISSVPFTITESGSYYFTNHIVAAPNAAGIYVDASDVTIDLNGFSLVGTTTSQDGILALENSYRNLTVRNGTITGWRNGIGAEFILGAVYEDLTLRNNTGGGLRAGAGVLIDRVRALVNGDHGILINEAVTIDSVEGSVIRSSMANGNGLDGIQFNEVDDFRYRPGGVLIEDNIASDNGGSLGAPYGAGIRINGNRARVEGNNVVSNDGFGINVTGAHNYIIGNSGAYNLNATGDDLGFDNFSFAGGNYAPEETSPTVTNPLSNVNY